MKRNVGILIFDDAEVLDFAGPFEVFSVTSELHDDMLFNVFTLSRHGVVIRAVNGLKVMPDYSIEDHPPIDILIISGGGGTRKVMHDQHLLDWISKIHSSTQITLSICSGSRLVGKIGLLDHQPFCTHHQVYDHMKEIAPLAISQKEKRFIQSGERLFTSGGISAGIDLSFFIVRQLLGESIAKGTAEYMEYNYPLVNEENHETV